LHGIGPSRAKILAAAGIATVEDLLYYFPRRYQDRTTFTRIADLKEGQVYTVQAQVLAKGERSSFYRRSFHIIQAEVQDASGRLSCVWFNQPYLKDYVTPGARLILYGKVERYGKALQMSAPEFELLSDEDSDSLERGKIVPVYTVPPGMSQRALRKLIRETLDACMGTMADFLPYDIRSRNNLLNVARSLINIHYPESFPLQKEAYRRLAFEEFFLFQLPLALRKSQKQQAAGIAHTVSGALVSDFIANLDFTLTQSQQDVIEEIRADMASPHSMQRLLQGDVGSGKTVVALISAMMAIQGGWQVAFLAPTEILAAQQYETIQSMTARIKKDRKPKVALLTGNVDQRKKEKAYQRLANQAVQMVIGTHALLERGVAFARLGLVVIDEQHKFGVGQRSLLPQKGANPDILIMTATPIPRTLAITLYGDLDVSVIKELPSGRKPITTHWITSDKRPWLYDTIKQELAKGRQAYIVYPIIEESYQLDLASAKKGFAELSAGVFREYRVGLVHGRMKSAIQDKTMAEFKAGTIDVLVATTVLEVGIDVPNASVMVVEDAQRFGLSQLHQLRGRIGRGRFESMCVLVSDAASPDARRRLTALVQYADGFRIAEEDLKIRGPGEFFGQRQHGLTELRIGNPLTQLQLLKKARQEALSLIALDPHFTEPHHAPLKEKLLQRFPEYNRYVAVG
jgi:ATP-dependent DNA helicase RecG